MDTNEQVISKQAMENLKVLSDVNLKISEAKNALFKVQEEETEYLVLREKKAVERIQKVLEESQQMVITADENFAQITECLNILTGIIKGIGELQSGYSGLKDEFEQANQIWEREIGLQEDQIVETNRLLKIQRVAIDNERKNIEKEREQLVEDQKKLHSDRQLIKRTIERLKKGKI